jgi:cytochrome c-type biogenesis protein
MLEGIQNWIGQVFDSTGFGVMKLFASFTLGLISAVASTGCGCNVPVLVAVGGYAGAGQKKSLRDNLLVCFCFILGTTFSLAVIGALLGSLKTLGRVGMIFAGLALILFGLASLKLIPFRLPSFGIKQKDKQRGLLGGMIFGLAMGAAGVGFMMACLGPLLVPVFGLATVQGRPALGALVLVVFGLGFSVPLAGIMLGVGMGKWSKYLEKLQSPIRIICGVIMIGAGFWILLKI